MGLDMYLERDVYIGSPDMREYKFGKDWKKKITIKCPGVIADQVKSVTEEVMYWRKCNAIHAWFVRVVQDGKDECERTWVAPEKIVELYDLCRELLKDKSASHAAEVLPPVSGFFFGSTEIDEWFWSDIERTVKGLKPHVKLINTPVKEGERSPWTDYYYQSSW